MNGAGSETAPEAASTPKISTGTVNGRISTAIRSPPRGSPAVRAAPIVPIKVSAGVPTSSVSANAPMARGSRLSSKPSTGAATTIGRPVVSQCPTARPSA